MLTFAPAGALGASTSPPIVEISTGVADEPGARAVLLNEKGESIGSVSLAATPHGVLLAVRAAGLPPGVHGFHIHETGRCGPPFASAGGHFNPFGKQHGLMNSAGPHAGDLPNVHVGQDGKLEVEFLAPLVTLGVNPSPAGNALLDADGAAIVIHAGRDDYKTDPAGNGGARIACGVILR